MHAVGNVQFIHWDTDLKLIATVSLIKSRGGGSMMAQAVKYLSPSLQSTHGGRKDPTCACNPPTSTSVIWHACPLAHPQTHKRS